MFGEIAFRLPGATNNKVFSFNSLYLTSLTPNQAVVTNASNLLTSLAYTNANTPSTLVQRDGSGNFSAGTITASLTGHASLDLLASNNLSDVTNAATARSNLGLVIGTNVEAWSATLDAVAAGTYTGSTSITTLGTITTGTWSGTIISPTKGGTGVANASGSTITLGGALTFSGAFTTAFTVTGNTSLTLPTSGTLMTTTGVTINGTANQISVSGSSPTFTLSFPSVLHSSNNTLDDGSGHLVINTASVNTVVSPLTLQIASSPGTATSVSRTNIYPSGSGASICYDFLTYNGGGGTQSSRLQILDNNFGNDFIFISRIQGADGNGYQTNFKIAANRAVNTAFNTLDNGTNGSASFGGPVTLSGNATSALQAVPLQQLNSIVAGNTWADFFCVSRCGGF